MPRTINNTTAASVNRVNGSNGNGHANGTANGTVNGTIARPTNRVKAICDSVVARGAAISEPARPATPTADELAEYLRLADRRKELEREARQVKSAEDRLLAKIEAYAAPRLAQRPSTILAGYVLSFTEGGKYPAWKQEFIAALGEPAAQEVVERTPAKRNLSVEAAR